MRRVLLAAVALLVLLVAVPPAGAQPAPPLVLRLVSQTVWLEPPGDAIVVLEPAGRLPDDAVVTVTVHARVDPPVSGFERAVAGDLPRIVLGLFRTPVAEVPRDDTGRLVLTIPVDVLGGERTDPAVVLADEGLFPVRIAVRGPGGDDLAEPLVLFLLRTGPGTEARPPLAVATVLPVSSGITVEPGSTTVAVLPEDRDRAATVADVLEQVPGADLTLHVRPELVEALGRTGLPADLALRDRLARAAADRPLAPATFTDVDPSALVPAGLTAELTAALRTGEDVLAAALPAADANRLTWVSPTGLDSTGLGALRNLGIRNLVLPAETVTGVEGTATGIGQLEAGTTTSSVPVAVADPGLSAALEPDGDQVLAAHHLAARLTATWLAVTEPEGDRHGTVLLPRPDWQPDAVFLTTLLSVVDELPATEPVVLDDLFDEVTASLDGPAGPALAPYDPDRLGPGFPERLTAARVQQAALGSMLAPGAPALDDVDLVVELSLRRGLAPGQREAYLRTADDLFAPLQSAIAEIPAETVTLAGRTTEIPLTIRSTVPYPVTVRLRLESPKLVFPEGEPLVTVDGSAQLRIPVEARSNGTFPLVITAVTPDVGVPVSPRSELTVRVTAVAGLGLALSVGAGLVLATWWVHHLRVSRRMARVAASADAATRHPAAGRTPAAPDPATEDTAEHPAVGP